MSTDGRFVSFEGIEIAYRDHGGDGLVLLHGIRGNLESMEGLAALPPVDRHVVTTDVRFDTGFERVTLAGILRPTHHKSTVTISGPTERLTSQRSPILG